MKLQFFDAHSHVNFSDYDEDRDEVVTRMRERGVWTVTVGVDAKTSKEAVSFAESHNGFFATVGLHPNNAPSEKFDISNFSDLVQHPKVVAVGECGLDYFRLPTATQTETGDDKEKGKTAQKREFEKQMEFAIAHNKPLMIHCRPSKGSMDAYEELLSVLETRKKEAEEKLRGNVHFFVGDTNIAKRFYDIDFTTSFTGVLTFTHDYDEVVRYAPLHMILTETDAPYAAPVPHRGKRNEPSYVEEMVRRIAKIRGGAYDDIREALLENALRVFAIAPQ